MAKSTPYNNLKRLSKTSIDDVNKPLTLQQSYGKDGEITGEITDNVKPLSKSNATIDNIASLLNESSDNGELKTPNEFYSNSQNTTSNIETDDEGITSYKKVNPGGGSEENIPTYFWIESLKNWGFIGYAGKSNLKDVSAGRNIVEYYDRVETYISKNNMHLYVWNGRDGWYNLPMSLKNYEDNILQRTLSEDERIDFCKANLYDPINLELILNVRNLKIERKGSFRDEDFFNYISKGVILSFDDNYSFYDDTTFQTLRPIKVYCRHMYREKENASRNTIPYITGNPLIWRLTSGELFLCYDFLFTTQLDNDKNRVSYNDYRKFANSCALAFFGKGDDKTIYDWLDFNGERTALRNKITLNTPLLNENDSTLVSDKENIVSVMTDVSSPFISLNTNLPNISVEEINNDDYVARY